MKLAVCSWQSAEWLASQIQLGKQSAEKTSFFDRKWDINFVSIAEICLVSLTHFSL